MRVLVTDGNYKHTLGIVRHLGKKGIDVAVTSNNPRSLSFYSRYCKERYVLPDYDDENYLQELTTLLEQNKFDLLIPVSYKSFLLLSRHKKHILKYTDIQIAEYHQIETAMNKKKMYETAESLNVPYPQTVYPKSVEQVKEISKHLTYPVVIKGIYEAGANIVDYAYKKEDLIEKYQRICNKFTFSTGELPMLQEYVEGPGYGFFALYQKGECKWIFMHQRIREFPVTGGASCCAKSYYDRSLMEYGRKILDHLNWHGVAMVEFKKDIKDNKYKLMEVNPKFWGSLDLALEAGMIFPYGLCLMSLNNNLDFNDNYDRKLIYHWPFSGDLKHGVSRLRNLPNILLDCINPKVKSNVWYQDIKPNLYELFAMFISFIRSFVSILK